MSALTDGTQAGTIPASPITPAPTTADTSTAPVNFNPLTGNAATAQIPPAAPAPQVAKPVTTTSSTPAEDHLTGIVIPAMNAANTAIADNNATPAKPEYVYNVPDGNGGFYSGPAANAPQPKPAAPAPTAEETAANTPDTGYKFAYSADGTKTQIPLTDTAVQHGLSDTNPTAGPIAPTTPVVASASLPSGTTYKQYSDGTYGTYDALGNYIGTGTQSAFQTAQAGASIMSSYEQIINGSFPLTANQQAQIQAAKDAAQKLINQQQTINANAQGATAILMNLRGLSGDTVGISTMQQTANAGAQKIADIQSQLASDIAKMTASFNSDNLTAVKDAYTAFAANSKALQDGIDKIHADTMAAAAAQEKTLNDQRTYDLNVAKFKQTGDQNAFDNAFKQEQEAFKEKMDKANLAVNQFKAGMMGGVGVGTGISQSAQMGASGAVDPASQSQVLAQISKTYGPMTATAIKGLADYSINPADWSSRATTKGGMSKSEAVALAKMVDPTYDDSQYTVRAAMKKNLTSGSYSQTITSANTLIQHLAKMKADMAALGNTGAFGSVLNPLKNLEMGVLGSGKLTAVQTDINAVASEASKVYKGVGSASEQEISDWKKTMNVNMSPDQQEKAIQSIVDLMAGKLTTLNDNYQGVMGSPLGTFAGGFQILTDRNAQTLKDMGIDPASVDPTYGNSPQDKMTSFYQASPQNASLVDSIVKAHPEYANDPAAIANLLTQNGISI